MAWLLNVLELLIALAVGILISRIDGGQAMLSNLAAKTNVAAVMMSILLAVLSFAHLRVTNRLKDTATEEKLRQLHSGTKRVRSLNEALMVLAAILSMIFLGAGIAALGLQLLLVVTVIAASSHRRLQRRLPVVLWH